MAVRGAGTVPGQGLCEGPHLEVGHGHLGRDHHALLLVPARDLSVVPLEAGEQIGSGLWSISELFTSVDPPERVVNPHDAIASLVHHRGGVGFGVPRQIHVGFDVPQ